MNVLTDMKVPGKKNMVTKVMIRIDTVSFSVLSATSCIFAVISSIFKDDFVACIARSFPDRMLRHSKTLCNWKGISAVKASGTHRNHQSFSTRQQCD